MPNREVNKGIELGDLVHKKGQAYGNSIPTVERILHLLYPDGIQPNQYLNASCLVRLLDKVKRIATDNDPFGESPWWDIAGYGLRMALVLEDMQNEAADNNGDCVLDISDSDDPTRVLRTVAERADLNKPTNCRIKGDTDDY